MTPSARNATLRPGPTPRFVAALSMSVLAHLAMPLVVSGGAGHSASSKETSRTLSVRVLPREEPSEPPPVSAAPTIDEPAASAPRVARVEPEPRVVPAAPRAEAPRSGAGVPDAPDLTYYPAKQLDIYPKLLSELDLRYRGKAADDGVTGRTLLLVLIDEIGAVKEVSVVEAEPPNAFEDDAQRALLAARFAPAYRNGRAVRSRVLIAVNYGVERGSP
jgi:periplasmic protein TonB